VRRRRAVTTSGEAGPRKKSAHLPFHSEGEELTRPVRGRGTAAPGRGQGEHWSENNYGKRLVLPETGMARPTRKKETTDAASRAEAGVRWTREFQQTKKRFEFPAPKKGREGSLHRDGQWPEGGGAL